MSNVWNQILSSANRKCPDGADVFQLEPELTHWFRPNATYINEAVIEKILGACPHRHVPPSCVCVLDVTDRDLTHSCTRAQLSPLQQREREREGEQGKQPGRERGQDCWTPALLHRSAGTHTEPQPDVDRTFSLFLRECQRWIRCLEHAAGHFGTVRPMRFGSLFGLDSERAPQPRARHPHSPPAGLERPYRPAL